MLNVNMIKKTNTYEAFISALAERIEKEGRGEQQRIAMEANISEPFLSQILKGKRKASFDTQIALANAAGYTYENFLSMGHGIVIQRNKKNPNLKPLHVSTQIDLSSEKPEPDQKPRLKIVTPEPTHEDVIQRFKDKKTAKLLNSMLADIEEVSPDDYKTAIVVIKSLHERISQKKTTNHGSNSS